MTEPWRYACPEGHRALKIRTGGGSTWDTEPGYHCYSCGETYDGKPTDLKNKSTGRVLEEP